MLGMSLSAAVAMAGSCGWSKQASNESCSTEKKTSYMKQASKDESSCSYTQKSSIVETAVNAGSFDTLVAAVKAAGLADALASKGPFTVFAPTDAAFEKIPSSTLNSLLEPGNKATLQKILKYHVVAGKVYSSDLISTASANTLNGKDVNLSLLVNNARLVKTDIKCTNGVIHVIDTVIMPPASEPTMKLDKTIVEVAKAAGSFDTLLTAVRQAGLAGALNSDGPFTVFAPTDEAFAALPESTLNSLLSPAGKSDLQAILKYHVIPYEITAENADRLKNLTTLQGSDVTFDRKGRQLFVDDARIVMSNLYTKNGIIHVIDAVILPEKDSYNDIIATARKAGSFNTLLTAVKQANLSNAIQSSESLTLFAPTDEAFADVPEETMAYLLSPKGMETLQEILKYHVVPGNVYSNDVLKTRFARTLQGSPVHFSLMINDAEVTRKDIKCSNGVIHVIDKVILPPAPGVALNQ